MYTCKPRGDVEFMHRVWQPFDALAIDSDTGSASSACGLTLLISALERLVPTWLGISAQIHGVWVYL